MNYEKLLTDFISDYLDGNIKNLATFDFVKLKGNKKYGCNGRTFDCDDTNISRAIFYCLYKGLLPELTSENIGTGKIYRGDTLNSFSSVFGNKNNKNYNKLIEIYKKNNLLDKIETFFHTYHTIGNFCLLPNKKLVYKKTSFTLNTYRGLKYHDFFDLFLNNLLSNNKIDLKLKSLKINNDFYFSRIKLEDFISYNFLEKYFQDNKPIEIFKPYFHSRTILKNIQNNQHEVITFINKYIDISTEIIMYRSQKIIKILEEKINKFKDI